MATTHLKTLRAVKFALTRFIPLFLMTLVSLETPAQVDTNSTNFNKWGKHENQKLAEMEAEEFELIFTKEKIKKGSTNNVVEELLGKPTDIKVERDGKTIWVYDSARLTGIPRALGLARSGAFKFAIISFDTAGFVLDYRYNKRRTE